MPPLGSSSFERSLAALDPEAFVRFVAAVHAAREGVAVDRDGGVLVVRGGGRRTRRVLPVAARRGPLRGPAPTGPVEGPVDEVVAQVDDGAARALAARRDARYRSPADLYDRVRYGLAPARADRLLDEHLRPRDAAGGTGRRAAAVAVLAALAVVLVVAHGAVGVDLAGVADGPEPTDSAATAGTSDARPTPAPDGRTYPPGVGAAGVEDAAALARAHGNAIGERPYRWTVVRRSEPVVPAGGRNRTGGGAVRPDAIGPNGTFTTYASGNRTYVRASGPDGTYVYERVRVADGGHPAVARAQRYIERYLAGTHGDARPVNVVGRPGYFVAVHGTPTRVGRNVSDFTGQALVTREGFVAQLDVSFTRYRDGRSYTVALFFEYDRLDDATPPGNGSGRDGPPNATDGTATPTPAEGSDTQPA